jgi:hypothetical protein
MTRAPVNRRALATEFYGCLEPIPLLDGVGGRLTTGAEET